MIDYFKDLESVSGGGKVIDMMKLKEEFPEKFNESGQMDYKWFEKDIRPNYNVYIRHDVDSVSLTMMTKPASEGGKGCQITDFGELFLHALKNLNEKYPCQENKTSITHLEIALWHQKQRTKNREKRGVEGKNEA